MSSILGDKWVRIFFGAAVIMLSLSFLVGCDSKAAQPYNDAPVRGHDDTPATILYMPDGFSNVAFKCYHGNGVYVIFHSDSQYGALSVVSHDSACS